MLRAEARDGSDAVWQASQAMHAAHGGRHFAWPWRLIGLPPACQWNVSWPWMYLVGASSSAE